MVAVRLPEVPPPEILLGWNLYNTPKGNECDDLLTLLDSVRSLPSDQVKYIKSRSSSVISDVTSEHYLHAYSVKGDMDDLLHLAMMLEETKNRTHEVNGGAYPAGAVIIADMYDDGFTKVCALVHQTTGSKSISVDGGKIYVFGNIAVVQGGSKDMNVPGHLNPHVSEIEKHEIYLNELYSRIWRTLQKIAQDCAYDGVVWHHGPVGLGYFPFFLARSRSTKDQPEKRPRIKAVVVTAVLMLGENIVRLDNGISELNVGTLEECCNRFRVKLLYAHASSLRLNIDPASNMPRFGEVWPAIHPQSLYTSRVFDSWDKLATNIFRLRAILDNLEPSKTVANVKIALHGPTAQDWAKMAIKEQSYIKPYDRLELARSGVGLITQYTDTPVSAYDTVLAGMIGLSRRQILEDNCLAVKMKFNWSEYFISCSDQNDKFERYILLTLPNKNSKDLEQAWVSVWKKFVAAVMQNHKTPPTIPKPLAVAWQYAVKSLEPHLNYVANHKTMLEKSTDEERNKLKDALRNMHEGNMTKIAKRSL